MNRHRLPIREYGPAVRDELAAVVQDFAGYDVADLIRACREPRAWSLRNLADFAAGMDFDYVECKGGELTTRLLNELREEVQEEWVARLKPVDVKALNS